MRPIIMSEVQGGVTSYPSARWRVGVLKMDYNEAANPGMAWTDAGVG
jgi:hypothetical protein